MFCSTKYQYSILIITHNSNEKNVPALGFELTTFRTGYHQQTNDNLIHHDLFKQTTNTVSLAAQQPELLSDVKGLGGKWAYLMRHDILENDTLQNVDTKGLSNKNDLQL